MKKMLYLTKAKMFIAPMRPGLIGSKKMIEMLKS